MDCLELQSLHCRSKGEGTAHSAIVPKHCDSLITAILED